MTKKFTQALNSSVHRLCRTLSGFARNRSGAVVLLFGLTLIPIMGFVGGAIDFAYSYRARTVLQNALDAAALAAGRELDISSSESGAQQVAMDVLQANLGPGFPTGVNANFDIDGGKVNATASVNVDTYILGVLGIDHFPVDVTSTVNIAGGTFEVVMALDNSGSMSGGKITDLRNAAKNLVDILFSNQLSSDHVTMGLVPFAASVNIGTSYANATWMDLVGQSSIHSEHFDAPLTRWAMFGAMPNVSWGGCVEVRPAPHDVTDSTPSVVDPNSLIVPLFAPDEPDTGGYNNNYLDDDDGACPWWVSGGSNYTRQRRTCKYTGENADTSLANGTRRGPNHLCDSQPLQPLTNNHGQITAAINAMNAYGGTNIVEGIMWGWRLLSPNEPFSEGKPYGEENHTKILILMSDGANWHGGLSNHNQSWFNAFGYHAQGRLGSPSNNTNTLRATMNTRTSQACTNAKAAGIVIYTLALEISDSTTEDMLRNCASGTSRYFTINNSNALDDVFEAIAQEITKLRITG